MASSIEEIRSWGMDNGWAEVIQPGGRLPTGLRAAYDNRDVEPKMAAPSVTSPFEYDGEKYDLPPVRDDDEIGERAPQLPKGTPVRSFLDKVKKASPSKPATRARKPVKPRVSVERVVSGGWRLLAQIARPINLPVARVLDVQAPVAGLLLEDVVRNTLVDRVLQPIARAAQGGEIAFALMGPPLLVAAIQGKPEMAPVLVPMLKESLRTWIDVAGPKLEELAAKDQKFQEQYGARIDEMIELFFAPVVVENSDYIPA